MIKSVQHGNLYWGPATYTALYGDMEYIISHVVGTIKEINMYCGKCVHDYKGNRHLSQ